MEEDREFEELSENESEEENDWDAGLLNGVVAYPSSLQNQCFLFIIGHLRESTARFTLFTASLNEIQAPSSSTSS